MDKLESEILAKLREAEALRKKADAAQAKAEQAEQEARILQRAAELRPRADGRPSSIVSIPAEALIQLPPSEPVRGGRQPGSISMRWRRVLADLAEDKNNPFDINGLILVARRRGVELEDRSARERIRRYLEQGFLVEAGPGRFQVTDAAIERFKLLE